MTHPRTLEACVAHTLGRPGYTSRRTAMTMRAQWESLPPDSRRRLLTILTVARTAPHAGRDNREWERLADWAQKHLDTPPRGTRLWRGHSCRRPYAPSWLAKQVTRRLSTYGPTSPKPGQP